MFFRHRICFWERAFWVLRRARKALKLMRNDFRLYEDVMPEATRADLVLRLTDLRQAIRCQEIEDLPGLMATTQAELQAAIPKRTWGWAADWFDIIVSALAVAFCFRAYYYEPFQIPTGSMQPTLYGIHVEDAAEPSVWDHQPLRFFKWLATGDRYVEVRATTGGRITGTASLEQKPGYTFLVVEGRPLYEVPDAAMARVWHALLKKNNIAIDPDASEEVLRTCVSQAIRAERLKLQPRQLIWSGYVKSGDFLFVNRWIWNFRHPRLGETIVFSTQGIDGLPDNQHYIKRLCGRPGDEVELKAGDSRLWVNGEPAVAPKRLAEIAQHERPWTGAPAYAGYRPAPPSLGWTRPLHTHFRLKAGEYVALGDNSPNSLDSRYWGTVPARNLLGPASFVHWPFTSPRWGAIR